MLTKTVFFLAHGHRIVQSESLWHYFETSR